MNTRTTNSPELWGGLECTINRVQDSFFDQFDYTGHYSREGDIAAICNTGIKKVRYPILWEAHQPEIDIPIDWTQTAERLDGFRNRKVQVIAGLVHHGSGPKFTNLLDENFPALLAAYAGEVATQFPWINDYTPVNEPLTTARFSGLYGIWYPHKNKDIYFLKMLLNQLKGTVLAMQAIRKINPLARLVQTEDLGKTYSTKKLKYQADFENHRRWLTYDLLCGGVNTDHPLWKYFIKKGITSAELEFFLENPCPPEVFGFNHYLTSERFLDSRVRRYPPQAAGGNGLHRYADVEAVRVKLKQETGLAILVKEAWKRYKKPIAITEVHLHCHREDQLRWFKQVWETTKNLSAEGVVIEGVTAWAMLGSFGWNKLLTKPGGTYEPGVFDIRNGALRPTVLAAYLTTIAGGNEFTSSIINNPGWWQRSTRFFHTPAPLLQKVLSVQQHLQPILILGKTGTLANAFAKVCEQRNLPFMLASRQDCDITDPQSVQRAIQHYRPWVIINATGYVRVDDAEQDAATCYAVNTKGAVLVAKAAAEAGIHYIAFSTDLVFDGNKEGGYLETDAPNPLNVYGASKAAMEKEVADVNPQSLIIRTSAFFGPWDSYNFVHYIRESLQQYQSVTVANDVWVSPTYLPHLANATLDLLVDNEKGIWHLANEGSITWAALAHWVAEKFDLEKSLIIAVPNEELRFPAKRPLNCVLSSERGIHLPTLDEALAAYLGDAVPVKQPLALESRA